MQKNFSIYLDVVRFLAAMAVFASHFVYLRWTGGAIPERLFHFLREAGDDAVMVFFVLSGFIIAFTVSMKDRAWRDYAFSRATRIYSVVIPAIFFVALLDGLGTAVNPAAYDGWWYADHALWMELFRGLTFSNEFWGFAFRMGSNGPFWSLGYEIWYYVLFGVAMFASGWRRILLFALIAILVGPKIWILAPVWVMGALFYGAVKRGALENHEGPTALAKEIAAATAPIIIYLLCRFGDFDAYFNDASAWLIALFYGGDLGQAHSFLWKWFIGVLVLIQFAGVALLLRRAPDDIFDRAEKPVRWLAGGSFTIYLVHYPLLQFFDAMMDGETSDPVRAFFLFVLTIGASFIFAEISERRLGFFRRSAKSSAAALRRRLKPVADDGPYNWRSWR